MKNKMILSTSIAAAIAIGISAFFSLSMIYSESESQNNVNPIDEDKILGLKGASDYLNTTTKLGGDKASIIIVEFGDYQCKECYDWFHNTFPAIKENYIDRGDINFLFFDFPILGDDSIAAANASWCAENQDMYWEYHDLLYSSQEGINDRWASPSNLKILASELGLNVEIFSKCVDGGWYVEKIKSYKQIGLKNGVEETPTFFLIDWDRKMQRIDGAQSFEIFKKAISEIKLHNDNDNS